MYWPDLMKIIQNYFKRLITTLAKRPVAITGLNFSKRTNDLFVRIFVIVLVLDDPIR